MKKKVEFDGPQGEDIFKNRWEGSINTEITVEELIGPDGILTSFETGHPISNYIKGYIFPEKAFKKLLNNVHGAKIEGVAVKFGISDSGHLHLVFIPIERLSDGSYSANYDDAQSTFYNAANQVVEFKDPILCIPPHKA